MSIIDPHSGSGAPVTRPGDDSRCGDVGEGGGKTTVTLLLCAHAEDRSSSPTAHSYAVPYSVYTEVSDDAQLACWNMSDQRR
jgi:hypothetical protein